MTSTAKEPSKSTFSKKEVRHQIALKLETALADLKSGMGEKKFKNRIKKASKLFSSDATPLKSKKKPAAATAKKSTPVKKAAAKKASKKAVAPSKKASPAEHA